MTSDWRETSLGDVLTLQRGFDITKKELSPGQVPVVSSSGTAYFHNEARVQPPGVVIGRKGSLGTVHMLRVPFWPHDTTLWIKDFKGNDPYFCSLLLRSLKLDNLDAGASNPTLNRNHAHRLSVRVPSIRNQRRIGAFVSAFDDLIEINERRTSDLKQLIRSIYRAWFVGLKFPGHKEARQVNSVLGMIPAGWSVRDAGKVFDVIGGGTPSKKRPEYWIDGTIPWYTPSDLTKSSLRFAPEPAARITELGVAKSAARVFPAGSVLMTSRATLGVLAIAPTEATCNQGFIVIPPGSGLPPEYIYEWLSGQAEALARIASGATFKEITKTAFKRHPVLVPDEQVLEEFGASVSSLSEMTLALEVGNRNLAAIRDLLFPGLITGQLDISDIDLGILTPTESQ
jgi:type I restriction enzyme S subunit